MPLPGKLKLKGGFQIGAAGVAKKKGKKKSKKSDGAEPVDGEEGQEGGAKTAEAIRYEEEFQFETERMKEGKARCTPWGPTYRAPPAVLHGYSSNTGTGNTTEQRLDYRCATKADKHCK